MTDALNGMLIVLIIAGLMALVVYLIHQLVKSKDGQIQSLTLLFDQKNDQINNLVAERDQLRNELDNLKSRKRFRQTRNTEAALLDMRAQLNNIKFQLEVEDDRRSYVNALLERVTQTVSEIREDPYAYDPDTPCVQKETKNYD
jgi:chromosome segregation ATPase